MFDDACHQHGPLRARESGWYATNRAACAKQPAKSTSPSLPEWPARLVRQACPSGTSKKTESRKKHRKDAKVQHEMERATETMPPARPRRSSPPSPRQSHRYSLRVHCRRPVRGGSHASLRLGVLWSPQSLCNASHLGGSPLFEDGQHAGMSICRDSLQTAESLRPLLRRAQRNTHAHWRSSLASRQRAASCLSVDSG